jgi:murein DD-endopeptidase MepM/ murein hydrolase activator NlpD
MRMPCSPLSPAPYRAPRRRRPHLRLGAGDRLVAACLLAAALLAGCLPAVPTTVRAPGRPVALLGAGAAEPAGVPPVRPLVVVREFVPPAHPFGPGHRGVDLAARPGQAVASAVAGTVLWAAPVAGRGVVSVADGGGGRLTYEPVTAAVAAGQQAEAGQLLGVVESADPGHDDCGGCLHWGRRLPGADAYADPLELLRPAPVRLLPVRTSAAAPAAAAVLSSHGAGHTTVWREAASDRPCVGPRALRRARCDGPRSPGAGTSRQRAGHPGPRLDRADVPTGYCAARGRLRAGARGQRRCARAARGSAP